MILVDILGWLFLLVAFVMPVCVAIVAFANWAYKSIVRHFEMWQAWRG